MHLRKPFVSPFRGLMRRGAAHAVLCMMPSVSFIDSCASRTPAGWCNRSFLNRMGQHCWVWTPGGPLWFQQINLASTPYATPSRLSGRRTDLGVTLWLLAWVAGCPRLAGLGGRWEREQVGRQQPWWWMGSKKKRLVSDRSSDEFSTQHCERSNGDEDVFWCLQVVSRAGRHCWVKNIQPSQRKRLV